MRLRLPVLPLVSLVSVAACGSGAPPPKPVPLTSAVELLPVVSADAPSAPLPSQDPCRGRSPCSVDRRHDAGRSAAAQAMFVLEVSLGPTSDDTSYARACEQREAWLVHQGPGAPPPRLLLESCNDGYGASGIGEDELEISDNLFVHRRTGGSAWRWHQTTSVRLDPPAVVGESWGSWWALSDAHHGESNADYLAFSASTSLELPRCDAQGQLPDVPDPERVEVQSRPVPALALPARLLEASPAEAARIDLSACASRLPEADPSADLRLAAVIDAPSKTLFVQVDDDVFGPGDELSVWTADEAIDAGSHCAESRPSERFAIDASGRLVGRASASAPRRVELGVSPDGRRRLHRISLATLPEAITVGYHDVDPKQPPTTTSSSEVEALRGEVVGLGRVRPMPEGRVRCVLEGERLVPVLADPPPRTQAIVGG